MATPTSLFYLVQQMNRMVGRRIDTLLRDEDLTAGQHLVLYLLSQHEPCSAAELARRTRMTAQAMGEFVKVLEQRGLVTRASHESGGRTLLLERTREGKALYERCRRLVRQAERACLSALPAAERTPFLAMFDTVRAGEAQRVAQEIDEVAHGPPPRLHRRRA